MNMETQIHQDIDIEEHEKRLQIRSSVGRYMSELIGVYVPVLLLLPIIGKVHPSPEAWYLLPFMFGELIAAGIFEKIEENYILEAQQAKT